jgi:hypothetical protein
MKLNPFYHYQTHIMKSFQEIPIKLFKKDKSNKINKINKIHKLNK